MQPFEHVLHHPVIDNRSILKTDWGLPPPDDTLTRSVLTDIVDTFHRRIQTENIDSKSTIWNENVERQKEIIGYLMAKDHQNLYGAFAHMFKTPLTNGTAQGDAQYRTLKDNEGMRDAFALMAYDRLVRVLQAEGVLPAFSPEEYYYDRVYDHRMLVPADDYLQLLQESTGLDLSAPQYSGGLFGLQTKYGLYCDRDFMAMGIALMMRKRFRNAVHIIEIGGGVGHLAYYLRKVGFKNITIVDLPTITATQQFFLGTNDQLDKYNFISPKECLALHHAGGVYVNVDSLPEMGIETAKEYIEHINKKATAFLSINHETNKEFTVRSLMQGAKNWFTESSRDPCWFRKGYVTEIWSEV